MLKKINLFICAVVCFTGVLHAQQEFTIYTMNNLYQASYVNPTAVPENKIHIGLPGMSSIYAGVGQNFMTVKSFLTDDNTTRIQETIDEMPKLGLIGLNTSVDLFSFRINVMHDYNFSFHVRDIVDSRLATPADFYRFFWNGNGQFIGKTANFSKTRFDINHYREYALGFLLAHPEKKLSFGGRAKLLFGKINIDSRQNKSSFSTNEDTYAWEFENNFKVNTSGLSIFETLDEGNESEETVARDYLLNTKNKGFGIDFGASYKFNDKLTFSANIKDLGFISWKDDVKNYETDQSTEFEGVGITEYSTGESIGEDIEEWVDTIPEIFTIEETSKNYKSWLHTQIYANATYQLFTDTKLVGTLFGEFYHGLRPGIVLGAEQRVGRVLNVTASYWGFNNSWNNIGLGLMVKPGPVQFYVVTDNVLAFVNRAKIGDFSYVPYSAKNVNIRIGLNLVIGKTREPEGQTRPIEEK